MEQNASPFLAREQELSGLCEWFYPIYSFCSARFYVALPLAVQPLPYVYEALTLHAPALSHLTGSPVCFILAAYNYPGAIRSTWGRMAEELDDATWDLLDGPGQGAPVDDMGLGMLVKMTRCHDLGLGQLFFPDLDLESDATCHEADSESDESGRDDGRRGKEKEKWKEEGDEDETVKMKAEDGFVVQLERLDLEAGGEPEIAA